MLKQYHVKYELIVRVGDPEIRNEDGMPIASFISEMKKVLIGTSSIDAIKGAIEILEKTRNDNNEYGGFDNDTGLSFWEVNILNIKELEDEN